MRRTTWVAPSRHGESVTALYAAEDLVPPRRSGESLTHNQARSRWLEKQRARELGLQSGPGLGHSHGASDDFGI
jgi:hypothetical protein